MSPLSLLFACDEHDICSQLRQADLEALGISLGDGSSRDRASGSFIFKGAAFDFAITAETAPAARHFIFCSAPMAEIQSGLSLAFGGAISTGRQSPPLVQALMALAVGLGSAFGAKASYWHPASVVADFAYFSDVVTAYENGAAFPSLVAVGFDTAAEPFIRTTGLAWVADQELAFDRDELPINEAMRYVVRLAHDLAVNGKVSHACEVVGMEPGEKLMLDPNPATCILHVSRKRSPDPG